MHVELYFCCGEQRLNEVVLEDIRSQAVGSPSSHLTFLGNAIHGTVGYFSSGWPVAYLVATVIFGLGLLIGSHVYVSQPEQVARHSSLPSRSVVEPKMEPVGRITGMVDCKWATKGFGISDWGLEEGSKSKVQPSEKVQSLIPNPQSLVHLGDKFALASGLMEITYDTGAKVILQGPVTYEVESRTGGFMSIGKLTARLEKKAEEAGNPKSPIPHPPSAFVVRTPTAIVTDLGTEFGVEVSKNGYTVSHVFRGSVKLQLLGAGTENEGNTIVLHENESIQTEKTQDAKGGRALYCAALLSIPMPLCGTSPSR